MLIVAIDGPSGVGKSTTAKALAARLRVPYLDTGAMYRTVGLVVVESGVDADAAAAVLGLLERHSIELALEGLGARVLLDGRPVGEEIRRPELSPVTSRIAVHPEVRRRMVELQRRFARCHGGILEGRDIGTVVFPETPHKFFLDASPEVRARRRYDQLRAAAAPGQTEIGLDQLAEEIRARDARDRSRSDSPLRRDPSYTYIDTSDLTLEEVLARIEQRVQSARGG